MSNESSQIYLPPWVDPHGGFILPVWLQGPRIGPQFRGPESSFVFGSTDTGKSRLLVRLSLMYRRHAYAKILDVFGAENDNESTVWLLCPESRDSTLCIIGNEVKVEGWDLTTPIGDFTLEKAKDYSVVITDRAFFGPLDDRKYDNRYYAALAKIFELAKRREGQKQLLVVMIREAWNVIYSQIKAGISRDEQQAQNEFRKLHNQRAHANLCTLIDTQRYTDLLAAVRTLADFRYIKGFGSQPIPDELDFLFKPWLFGSRSHRDWMMRNTPVDEFILLTKNNGVGYGSFANIPWHIQKGYSPLKKLGITVSLKPKEDTPEGGTQQPGPWGEAVYVPSNNDQHLHMQELHEQGLSYKDIAARMAEEGVEISWQKVKYHIRGECGCLITTGSKVLPGPPANQAKA